MNTPCGPLAPLQRDKQNDFACIKGAALYDAQVRHVLLTEADSHHGAGETPWRTECGSALHTLRHAGLDAASAALARKYVAHAFARWLPHLALLSVTTSRSGPVLNVEIAYAAKANITQHYQSTFTLGAESRN